MPQITITNLVAHKVFVGHIALDPYEQVSRVLNAVELQNLATALATATEDGEVSYVVGADPATPDALEVALLANAAHALLQFDFAGGAPPVAGANAGKFGFCHTDGGDYLGGEVFFDNGVALTKGDVVVGTMIVTTTAVVGVVALALDTIFFAQTATAPYTWTAK